MFHHSIIQAIKAHALEEYPKEAVGVVAGGAYIRARNIAPNPLEEWELHPSYLHVADLQAVVHSHPDGPDHPSQDDMESQIEQDIPFGICAVINGKAFEPFWWGDGVPVPPLIGREFRHGVTDCYSIIRDWYWLERNIRLPEFPREMDWWHEDDNLYMEGFTKAGFRLLQEGETPEVGDVFLTNVASKKINHGGVYVGNGYILHHLQGQLSVREIGGRYLNDKRRVIHWIRHD